MRAVARSTRSSASARRHRRLLSACSRQRSTASASGPASSIRSSCSIEGAVSRSRTRRSGAPRARSWTRPRPCRRWWPSPRTRWRFARRGTRARTPRSPDARRAASSSSSARSRTPRPRDGSRLGRHTSGFHGSRTVECYGPRSAVIRFRTAGRGFYAYVSFGPRASSDMRRQTLHVLDDLRIAAR